jgi:hypothetical protein
MKKRAVLYVLLILAAAGAHGQDQMVQSACDGVPRPQGVGYTPPPGSRSCLFTGVLGNGTSICYPMDLSAHGFGESGHSYNYQALLARYGPNFHGTDVDVPRFLALEFENLTNHGDPYLQRLCCSGEWGTETTLSCYPTHEERHDFFAVNPDIGRAIVAGINGGGGGEQPRITGLTTPGPGRIAVKWFTRTGGTSFEVTAGPTTKTVAGDVTSAEVELPAEIGGSIDVTVTAFQGSTSGRPSRTWHIVVAPRPATVPDRPVDPPVDPPTVPPVDPPTVPPVCPAPASLVIPADVLETLRLFPSWLGKPIPGTGGKAARLARLVQWLNSVQEQP